MKITFTLKHLALLIAFILLGVSFNLKAQTVIPVGAASTYKTIQTAYDAIKTAAVTTPITGAYVLELQTDYVPTSGTTLETFPITLNAINGASATNTITIKPATGAKITLSYPNQTVVASGLNYGTANNSSTLTVTNDVSILSTSSYVSGSGTSNNPFRQLTAVNVETKTLTFAASTFTGTRTNSTLFFGPQQTKTINLDGAKYVIIDGISRTDASTGLTISNPNCIYSQTIYFTGGAQYNTIKNCIIRGANQTSTDAGAGLGGTIFYNGGNFNTITQNDVCDMDDGVTPMPSAAFQVVGKNGAINGNNFNNTISENNIYNIENYWSSASTNTGFLQFGSTYDTNSKNNYVLNNKMYWTRTPKLTGTVVGIGTGGNMNGIGNKFEGNTIGYTNAEGTGTVILDATGATFKGFSNLRDFTCKNNKIANINMTGTNFTGLEFFTSHTSTTADDYCSGNIIENINLTLTANGTLNGIMINVSNNNNSNIKNNIIRNLTAESATPATVCTVVGINVTGAANTNIYNYSGNQIYNLTAGKTTETASTAANVATALSMGANARTVEKNIIYNIAALNNTTTAVVTGIQTAGGNTTGTVLQNNIVRLGTDVSNDAIIYGINQTATAATNVLKGYHNSVFIGGTAPASPAKKTYAFYTAGSVVPATNELKNNIFANQRTITSATAKHYAIGYATANVIKTCDYNLYWATPVGLAAGTDKTLSEWQTLLAAASAFSFSTDPSFVDATATTPNLRLNSVSSDANTNGANLASTVADDYLGYNRADFTPYDMGAYAYSDNSTLPTLDVATAVTAITTTTASSGGNVTLDGGSSVTARGVCWNAAAIPTIANNPTSNGTGTGTFTSSITGLTANTVYNLRSYATNGTGTAYSPNISFTTLPGTPTSPVTNTITATGFKANWTAPSQGAAAFTYTLEYSTISDMSYGVNTVAAITTLNSTVSGLIPSKTYYYRVKAVNASGSGAYSSIQTVTTSAATVVNVTGAATETGLTLNHIVNVQNGGILTINNNTTVYALNIDGGGAVNLIDTKTLTVTNLTINSDATNGTGTFKDLNANGGLTVNGTTTVNQNLASYRSWYMTSPVAGAQPTGMNRIFYYNEADNTWPTLYNSGVTVGQTAVAYGGNSFEAGKGYIVVPDDGDNNIQFVGYGNGKLNAGVKTITLKKTTNATKTGFNLIGNPYPSYLDWSSVYANSANAAVLSDATIWYRTKVETLTPGVYEYKFWTVNGAGVGNVAAATKDIPPMQAFWVRTNANNSTLTLNKDMRAHAPASNKMLKAPAAKNSEMSLVRLQVSNGANTDEAVIYFSANASNERDAYDAPKMSNGNAAIPEIYTTIGAEHIVINGMNTIPLNQEIALGFVAGNATAFSLKANEVSNLPADVKVMLKDNVTKAETDITNGISTYQFAPIATNDNRFSVIFRSAGATTDIDNQADNKLLVYSNNKQITVVCNDIRSIGTTLSVYNAVGQKLLNKQLTGTITTIDGNFEAGVYMVTLNNLTRKVIVK